MLERAKFDLVLAMLARLIAENECFILFAPPFAATIEVRDLHAWKALEDQGVTGAERDTATKDITDLMLANLQDEVNSFVEHKTEHNESETSDTAQEWRSRSEAVAQSLIGEHLRRRYLLKRLSKAPAFTDIDWDVKVKVGDASESNLQPFPYATIKLRFQREFGGDVVSWLSGRHLESVQVNFSSDELAYLIHSLELANAALHKAEGGS